MMRRYIYILLAALALGSCSQSEDSQPTQVGQGAISFSTITRSSVDDADSDSVEDIYEIPEELIPSTEDFTLYITGEYISNESGEIVSYDEAFTDVNSFNTNIDGTSPLELWSGDYVAQISCGGDTSQESETNACFGSAQYPFTIVVDDYSQEAEIKVSLLNSIIRLRCNEYFENYFTSAQFTITTSNGGEFTFDLDSEENEYYIVFVAPDTQLTLSGEAVRKTSGESVTFTANEIGQAKGGYMNTIMVEAQSIGSLSVTIAFSEGIIKVHEEDIELNF